MSAMASWMYKARHQLCNILSSKIHRKSDKKPLGIGNQDNILSGAYQDYWTCACRTESSPFGWMGGCGLGRQSSYEGVFEKY